MVCSRNQIFVALLLLTDTLAQGGKLFERDYRTCLTDKRIVLIGDSTIRYQYLTLAYFAEYGTWPPGQLGNPSPLWEGSLKNNTISQNLMTSKSAIKCLTDDSLKTQQNFKRWLMFYSFTNSLFNGHETCDCYRSRTIDSVENRVYVNNDSFVGYFQYWGDCALPRGNMSPDQRLQCAPGICCSRTWEYRLEDFAKRLRAYQPTHLLFNIGLWHGKALSCSRKRKGSRYAHKSFLKAFASAVRRELPTLKMKIWRTTPVRLSTQAQKSFTNKYFGLDISPLVKLGWTVHDAFSIANVLQGTSSEDAIFADYSHLSPAGNVALGKELLSDMCVVKTL